MIFSGCSQKQVKIPKEYNEFKVVNLDKNQTISYDKFINEILQKDIILLGEVHTDEYHHFMQNKIILDLYKFKNLSVVFEMLETNKQNLINKAKQNPSNINPKKLKNAINWEKWDYSLYKNIVESAFYSDMKLLAGNISKDEIDTIYNGVVPLNGVISTTKDVKNKLFEIIKASHKIDDKEVIRKMVEIQQFKDRRMADILVNSSNLAVLVAGRNHTNKTIGVPLHIIDFNKNKKFSSVGLGYDCEKITQETKKEQDYLILFKKEGVICE